MIRLLWRLPTVFICVLLTLLALTLGSLCRSPAANRRIIHIAYRVGLFVFGIRVRVQGALSQKRPLLLVSNHFSYLDIFAIGSVVPAAFTPKSEIAGWPVIGPICKMCGCLFIDRRPSQTLANKQMLEEATRNGEVISLFAEGTTNEGKSVLPFRSSYFSLAEVGTFVQPLSVVYTHLNGRPVDEAALPVIGWYGDMYFAPHMFTYLQQKGVEVTLVFHEARSGEGFSSRKELAAWCHSQVESAFDFSAFKS